MSAWPGTLRFSCLVPWSVPMSVQLCLSASQKVHIRTGKLSVSQISDSYLVYPALPVVIRLSQMLVLGTSLTKVLCRTCRHEFTRNALLSFQSIIYNACKVIDEFLQIRNWTQVTIVKAAPWIARILLAGFGNTTKLQLTLQDITTSDFISCYGPEA